MSTTTHAVWTPTTPDERRHAGVRRLVEHVMSHIEGNRLAAAYGVLAGLVTSATPEIRAEWAPEFVAAMDTAMTERPFDRRSSTA